MAEIDIAERPDRRETPADRHTDPDLKHFGQVLSRQDHVTIGRQAAVADNAGRRQTVKLEDARADAHALGRPVRARFDRKERVFTFRIDQDRTARINGDPRDFGDHVPRVGGPGDIGEPRDAVRLVEQVGAAAVVAEDHVGRLDPGPGFKLDIGRCGRGPVREPRAEVTLVDVDADTARCPGPRILGIAVGEHVVAGFVQRGDDDLARGYGAVVDLGARFAVAFEDRGDDVDAILGFAVTHRDRPQQALRRGMGDHVHPRQVAVGDFGDRIGIVIRQRDPDRPRDIAGGGDGALSVLDLGIFKRVDLDPAAAVQVGVVDDSAGFPVRRQDRNRNVHGEPAVLVPLVVRRETGCQRDVRHPGVPRAGADAVDVAGDILDRGGRCAPVHLRAARDAQRKGAARA